jgi:hypothetical protein
VRLTVFALLALAAFGCADETKKPIGERPLIVPWRAIGAAELGMTQRVLEDRYPKVVKTERFAHFFPVGTRYQGKHVLRRTYRMPGGTLTVSYVDGRAKVLSTTSPRYRTRDGIGAGFVIHPTRCSSDGPRACWRGFGWDDCTGQYERMFGRTEVDLGPARAEQGPRRFVVSYVAFGDPDVLLTCF